MRDGPDHVRLRRLMAPPLRGERMRSQAAAIEELTRRELTRWPRGRAFPLLPRMRALTLDVILRVVFGLAPSPRLVELQGRLERMLAAGTTWMVISALGREFPGSPWSRFLRLRRDVIALLREELGARSRGEGADDALSHLRPETDTGELTEDEVVDQLITLLVAGHETTATSLAWAFDLVLRDPATVARLRGDTDTARLEGVVKETLRLRPIFRMTSRRLRRPVELGDWRLPAGITVGANILAIHLRPDLYADPGSFVPERWSSPPTNPGAFLPFGAGIRRCLGAAFAPFEMGIVVQTVLREARLRPADQGPEPMSMHAVTVVPKHGTRVVVDG